MGNFFYKQKQVKILINQAFCHQCRMIVRDEGICKCGNVRVYGQSKELGRKIKDKTKFSDCNLLEY